MTIEQAMQIAKEVGFEVVEKLNPETLVFRADVRAMCNAAQCPYGYGKSWSCPPAAAPLEELTARAKGYSKAILVQTICRMEDEYDLESVGETEVGHAKMFMQLADRMQEEAGDAFPLGAGYCLRCKSCTYPDEPCRFPDKMITSMEASGLLVSQVCKDNDVPYYYGRNTVAYTSCCLFN